MTTLAQDLDSLSVLQWKGHDWWGLDGEPATGTELGDASLGVSAPSFDGNGRLTWLEATEDGRRLAAARWEADAWIHEAPGPALGNFGGHAGGAHLGVDIDTWDTVWGIGNYRPRTRLIQMRAGGVVELPLPEVSGGDATTCGAASKRPCVPGAMVELDDGGGVVAVHPDAGYA